MTIAARVLLVAPPAPAHTCVASDTVGRKVVTKSYVIVMSAAAKTLRV